MKKKITLVLVLLVLATSLFATDQYIDTPDGRRLVLHEDGTYEYLEVEPLSLVGAVYTPDFYKLIEFLITPGTLFYNEEIAEEYNEMVSEAGSEEVFKAFFEKEIEEFQDDYQIVFGAKSVLFAFEGETTATNYKVLSDKTLMIEDEGEQFPIGAFNADYTILNIFWIFPFCRIK